MQRLAEVEAAAEEAQNRVKATKAELALLKSQDIDQDDVRTALETFLPAWDGLLPCERTRLLALVIDQVDYNAPASEVAITFRPCGIRTLLEENTP